MRRRPIDALLEQALLQGQVVLNKEALDRVFGLARIEVLDGIKQDFIKWITVVGFIITLLGLIGANAAIQNAVKDRVYTTLESFRGDILKAQVSTEVARREIEQVQTTVSESTKELIRLEATLKEEIAKGNDLSAVLQRGLKEYFQIRSLTATCYLSFDRGFKNAFLESFAGIRLPGSSGQDIPDFGSAPEVYSKAILNLGLELHKSANAGFSIPLALNFTSRDDQVLTAKLSPDVLQLDALGARPVSFLDGVDQLVLSFAPQVLSPDVEKFLRNQIGRGSNADEEFEKLRAAILAFYKRISSMDINVSINGATVWAYRVQTPFSALNTARIRQGKGQVTFAINNPIADVRTVYDRISSENEPQDRISRSLLLRLQ